MSSNNLLYSKAHEWVRADGDTAVVGITDYAQTELGDVVFVELPALNDKVAAHEAIASVESVKAVSEVYTPVGGEVTEVNSELEEAPELINEDPYGKGWIFKLRLNEPADLDDLMSAKQYDEYVADIK